QESQAVGSELLNAGDFVAITPDVAATTTGSAAVAGSATSTIASAGNTLQIQIGATTRTYAFVSGGGTTMPTIDIADVASDTIGEVLAQIEADMIAQGAVGADVSLVGGNISVTAGNLTDSITITDGTTGSTTTGFGFTNGTYDPTVAQATLLSTRVPTVAAQDSNEFIAQSISGGAITVYAENGAPANVQMRWAKVNSTVNGGAERWNLFISTNAEATGAQTMWTRVGGDYTFGANGSPNPAVDSTDLTALMVNGVLIGDVRLQHGANGLTQFADPNGTAEVTALNQNGYAAGEFVSVAVNDNGRVVVSYNNGQQLEVAQVVTANFNAVNQLKRMDGGVFAATSESGEPILDNDGGIIGASLEASNTDISEEFTKLIVTQQAYAAGTRIVSTADEMLQEALNMVR
ncbi:MAG: flagellar hook-basal body complex protein, partial [Devosia sp.]